MTSIFTTGCLKTIYNLCFEALFYESRTNKLVCIYTTLILWICFYLSRNDMSVFLSFTPHSHCILTRWILSHSLFPTSIPTPLIPILLPAKPSSLISCFMWEKGILVCLVGFKSSFSNSLTDSWKQVYWAAGPSWSVHNTSYCMKC